MTGDMVNARNEIDRALEIDPLSATALNLRAYHQLLRGDGANAMRAYQILLRGNPEFQFGRLNYAFTALATREYGDAAQALVAAFPQFGPDVGLIVAAASGQGGTAEASQLVSSMGQMHHASVTALLYAAIGDREAALGTLEDALESASDANLPYWLLHPLFTPLRNNPRFRKIVQDVGVSVH
jgi:tetratricopeptide (TPR) repeat protein